MTDILIIHDSMAGGGAEHVLLTMLKYLDRKRFKVTLLLIYGEGVYYPEIPDDIEVLSLYGSHKGQWHRMLTHFYGVRNHDRLRRARRLLGNRRFDVTVSFMEGPAALIHSRLMDLSPVNVTWVHIDVVTGRWYDFWFNREDEREFYAGVDRIAFVSQMAQDAFETLIDTNAVKEVIYNPIDVQRILRLGSEDDARMTVLGNDTGCTRIVNVGRLVKQKRQDRLIRAAALLKERGFRFTIDIFGEGKLEGELKSLARELGVDDCVRFAGYVNNPYPAVRAADLFCLTSEAEGFSLVVAEALLLGTPVISTRTTGPVELLSHGGGVLTGDTPEEIADAIGEVISREGLLAELARQTVRSARQFRIDVVMEKIEKFISG